MNLNKALGRVATTFVAATMLASVSAVPAFAAYDPGATYTSKVTFNQYLVLDVNAKAPTFNNITYTIAGVAGKNSDGMPITSGINPEAVVVSFDGFASTDTVNTDTVGNVVGQGKSYVSDEVSLDLSNVTFTEPGIYRYSIDPDWAVDTTAVDGVTLSTDVHYLDVYVVDESGTLKVDSAVMHDTDATAGNDGEWDTTETKTNSFIHTYQTKDLTLDKVVAGNMGNKNANFEFKIQVNSTDSSASKTYKIKYGVNGEKTVTSGEQGTTIELKHGQTATIYGLSANDTYTITETSYANDGYTTAYTVDVAKAKSAPENATKDNTASGTMGSAEKNVVFYNTRDAVSPTGIVMNVAPYVLLVVVAAAGCFVFLRKRRED